MKKNKYLLSGLKFLEKIELHFKPNKKEPK